MWQSFVIFIKTPLNSSPMDIFIIIGLILLFIIMWHMIVNTLRSFERAVIS